MGDAAARHADKVMGHVGKILLNEGLRQGGVMKDLELRATTAGESYWDSQRDENDWPEDYVHPSTAFADGYKQCAIEVKEQIKEVIKELDKIRKDHAGLGIVKVLLRGIG